MTYKVLMGTPVEDIKRLAIDQKDYKILSELSNI